MVLLKHCMLFNSALGKLSARGESRRIQFNFNRSAPAARHLQSSRAHLHVAPNRGTEGPTTDTKWGGGARLRKQGLASGIPPTIRKWATVALPVVCARCVWYVSLRGFFLELYSDLKDPTSNLHSNELNANPMGISSVTFVTALKLYTWRQYTGSLWENGFPSITARVRSDSHLTRTPYP